MWLLTPLAPKLWTGTDQGQKIPLQHDASSSVEKFSSSLNVSNILFCILFIRNIWWADLRLMGGQLCAALGQTFFFFF